MVHNPGFNKILWLSNALLALIAAIIGVVNPDVYSQVVSDEIMPGVFGQDLLTIAASVTILILLIRLRKDDSVKQIIILGILGYFFYAYGIYVIERLYNVLYYLYLIIFSLSFWSIIYGLATIRKEILRSVTVSGIIRFVSAGFSLLVALIFNILWIIQLLPLVQTGEKIEFFYSVYILDLCFIMPAFVILGILTIRNRGTGLLLIPAVFILGFTLIFSLAVSTLVRPLFDLTITPGDLVPSLVLSIVFLVLAAWHLRRLVISQ